MEKAERFLRRPSQISFLEDRRKAGYSFRERRETGWRRGWNGGFLSFARNTLFTPFQNESNSF